MFKKIFSLTLIALMLFSFVAGVSAQNNYISIYSRTQDNDGDGVFEFYNKDCKLFKSIQIKKGERKTYSLENVDKVIFHSKGRNSHYDARIEKLTNYWNDRNMDNIDINVDVNFYSKKVYYNIFWFNHDIWIPTYYGYNLYVVTRNVVGTAYVKYDSVPVDYYWGIVYANHFTDYN